MCLCVCRLPRAFIENVQPVQNGQIRPFLIGVTKFDDIRMEGVMFQPSSNVDKVIVAQCTTIQGAAWDQLANIPVRDCLMMLDDFPNFPSLVSHTFAIPPIAPQHGFNSPSPGTNYTPPSPDDTYEDGDRFFNFPRYSPSVSPGIVTFPPTPNCGNPENVPTPGAPRRRPRTIPPFRLDRRPNSIPPFQLDDYSEHETDEEITHPFGGGGGDVESQYRYYV